MIRRFSNLIFSVFFLALISAQSSAAFDFGFKKRNHIYVVGSSTVSPLMASVAEEFARSQNLKNSPVQTPVVESNGTANGFKIFCQGVGLKYPDFADASRSIHEDEIANCNQNGVNEIAEIKIGYDGIVIANFVGRKKVKLTEEQVFLALAEKVYDKKSGKLISNPYEKWSQIDSKLPNSAIAIYGPPATSGTRDVFVEMVMEGACLHRPEFVRAIQSDALRKKQCKTIRRDGKFIESGENDNLIIENVKNHPNAFGIFGFNFLVVNRDKIQPVLIDNVEPTFETIASKKYKLSRPLFVYFKKEHLSLAPQMRDFIKEIINEETIGSKGYLIHNGLVPMTNAEFEAVKTNILSQL